MTSLHVFFGVTGSSCLQLELSFKPILQQVELQAQILSFYQSRSDRVMVCDVSVLSSTTSLHDLRKVCVCMCVCLRIPPADHGMLPLPVLVH
ncbi:hypothetical protein F7725_010961 [Dissostichus mawsoni]|uniref:Uncharacterized protein n=1 Tax=Dissostichus mawsoni TaxID=36200 RepID=A0A7J5Z832_DISMA|nr:hypothetical protein F7725_010961 [Dissostichus mawsoni]